MIDTMDKFQKYYWIIDTKSIAVAVNILKQ